VVSGSEGGSARVRTNLLVESTGAEADGGDGSDARELSVDRASEWHRHADQGIGVGHLFQILRSVNGRPFIEMDERMALVNE